MFFVFLLLAMITPYVGVHAQLLHNFRRLDKLQKLKVYMKYMYLSEKWKTRAQLDIFLFILYQF